VNPRLRPPRRPAPRDRSAGFTLIELLVVLGFLALTATLAVPAIQNLIIRSKTEGFAREASVLMQRTRLEAIKVNRAGVVHIDPANRRIRAFIDADRDFTYNPDPNEPPRTTDYTLGQVVLPADLEFRDPDLGGVDLGSIEGFTPVEVDGANPRSAYFRADGSVADAGAFRVCDPRGNCLEIRVDPPASGRIDLLKWEAVGGEEGTEDWRGAGDPAADGDEPGKWR
jgi:type II secretory pathway pseudopilin PulG